MFLIYYIAIFDFSELYLISRAFRQSKITLSKVRVLHGATLF